MLLVVFHMKIIIVNFLFLLLLQKNFLPLSIARPTTATNFLYGWFLCIIKESRFHFVFANVIRKLKGERKVKISSISSRCCIEMLIVLLLIEELTLQFYAQLRLALQVQQIHCIFRSLSYLLRARERHKLHTTISALSPQYNIPLLRYKLSLLSFCRVNFRARRCVAKKGGRGGEVRWSEMQPAQKTGSCCRLFLRVWFTSSLCSYSSLSDDDAEMLKCIVRCFSQHPTRKRMRMTQSVFGGVGEGCAAAAEGKNENGVGARLRCSLLFSGVE